MSYWVRTQGSGLMQGDRICRCPLPVFHPTLPLGTNGEAHDTPLAESDVIVLTQSCDLENQKAPFVALCPIYNLPEFEESNPRFRNKGEWENVRKGRVEGLHLLASPVDPEDNRAALVVDFSLIVSLPIEFLSAYAAQSGERWRLQSPFLEHFSQAFARFFMRVGLPSSIPPYK